MAGILLALALGSVVFLSVVLIVTALMLRSRWESIDSSNSSDSVQQRRKILRR